MTVQNSMAGSSDDILERTRTREVTGVFHSRKALIAAADELLRAGFDRADIDVSASLDELQRRVNYASTHPADLADFPRTPRNPFMGEDDSLNTEIVAGSVAGCIGAMAAAFYLLVVKSTDPAVAGVASILCGLAVGAVALLWTRKRLQRERARGLEQLSEAYGLLIWVRVRSPEKESEAQEILVRNGGQAVHIHEIDLAKRADELPFHSLRPDPWLGDEPLGKP